MSDLLKSRINRTRRGLAHCLIACLISLVPAVGIAQGLPPVNLGNSSFMDGGPVPSGVFLQEIADFYTANSLRDSEGDEVPAEFGVDVAVIMNHLIWLSDTRVFGARLGLEALMPIVMPDIDKDTALPLSETSGIGDLILGVIFQFDPVTRADGSPLFVNRINLVGSLPTGRYSDTRNINPGNNFTTFNPYWAATVYPHKKLELSWRLHWLWSGKNRRPNIHRHPLADSTRAGQAFHANFAASWALTPRFRLGLNGYYVKQISNAKVDGQSLPRSKEQVLALGPGAWFALSKHTLLIGGVYLESAVRNRPSGDRFVLRVFHRF